MYTINNNDIDINGDSPSKLYNGKYITKYIGIPISDYNLFILYSIITIISLFLILYFKIKNI